MRGGVKMQDLATPVLDDEETVKNSERQGWHGKEVARPAKAGMLSGRQTHRGKSQKPRSLDSRKEGNRFSEAYR